MPTPPVEATVNVGCHAHRGIVYVRASEIAALYTDVGGALRRLSDKKGPDVAEALWQRYRLVRLQSALASEQSRREAQRMLNAIRKDAATAGQ